LNFLLNSEQQAKRQSMLTPNLTVGAGYKNGATGAGFRALFGSPKSVMQPIVGMLRRKRNINRQPAICLTEASEQLRCEIVGATPALEAHVEAWELVSELVEDRDWVSLAELIAEWDQTRAVCPMNRRLIYTALECFHHCLHGSEGRRQDTLLPAAQDAMDELGAMLESRNPHRVIAPLYAHLCLEKAWGKTVWARRNLGKVPTKGKALEFVAEARAVIEIWPDFLASSPLAASLQFNMLPFDPSGPEVLASAYKRRVVLDPGDLAVHYAAGRFLLPQWLGTYDRLELLGRQAVAWTQEISGAAAYAALYLGALDHDVRPVLTLDKELFSEGVEDLLIYRGRDPSHVPIVLQPLWNIANLPIPGGLSTAEKASWEDRKERIAELTLEMARCHLTAVHPGAWEGGPAKAMELMSIAMQDELSKGLAICVDETGIHAE
jgi:hypothetical protein